MRQSHADGCFMGFDTLTVADDRGDAGHENPKALRDCDLFVCFFQAEDGIRDHCVTGVQTCALPICPGIYRSRIPAVPFLKTCDQEWDSRYSAAIYARTSVHGTAKLRRQPQLNSSRGRGW